MHSIKNLIVFSVLIFCTNNTQASWQSTFEKFRALTSISCGTSFHHHYFGSDYVDATLDQMVKEIKQRVGIPSAREVHIFYLNDAGHKHFGIENLIATDDAIFIDKEWFEKLPVAQQRFLIGHELAHIYYRDVKTVSLLVACAAAVLGYSIYPISKKECSVLLPLSVLAAVTVLIPSYGRYIEQRADCCAARALCTTQGGIDCCNQWLKEQNYDVYESWLQQCVESIFATHPSVQDRLTALKALQSQEIV